MWYNMNTCTNVRHAKGSLKTQNFSPQERMVHLPRCIMRVVSVIQTALGNIEKQRLERLWHMKLVKGLFQNTETNTTQDKRFHTQYESEKLKNQKCVNPVPLSGLYTPTIQIIQNHFRLNGFVGFATLPNTAKWCYNYKNPSQTMAGLTPNIVT